MKPIRAPNLHNVRWRISILSGLSGACLQERCYHTERPHSQLGYLSPLSFKSAWLEAQRKTAGSLTLTLDQLMGLTTVRVGETTKGSRFDC